MGKKLYFNGDRFVEINFDIDEQIKTFHVTANVTFEIFYEAPEPKSFDYPGIGPIVFINNVKFKNLLIDGEKCPNWLLPRVKDLIIDCYENEYFDCLLEKVKEYIADCASS